MVKVLTAVLTDGLVAVDAACAEALEAGLASADVILNTLSRRQQSVAAPAPVATPEHLVLALPPRADCDRYDALRTPPPVAIAPAVITEAAYGAL
jgi:hypothetical protein